MALPKINPTTTKSWSNLQEHFTAMETVKMQTLFANETDRKERMSLTTDLVSLDFSKNRITSQTIDLLVALAKETKLDKAIAAQFNGAVINETEVSVVVQESVKLPIVTTESTTAVRVALTLLPLPTTVGKEV